MIPRSPEVDAYLAKTNAEVSARMRAYRKQELARWGMQDRHGRWVVIEPRGVVIAATGEKRNDTTPRRGRRFSSLSRARHFAAEVGGMVRRWRSAQWERPGGRRWAIPGLGMRPYVALQRH